MRRKENGLTRFLRMKIVLVLNVALLGVVAWGFGGEYVRNRELQRDIDGLKTAADALQNRNVELVALRERLSGDGQVEREARLKLNLMKPGEKVVIIKELDPVPHLQDTGPEETRAPPGGATPAAPNPLKWLHFFLRDTFENNDIHQ